MAKNAAGKKTAALTVLAAPVARVNYAEWRIPKDANPQQSIVRNGVPLSDRVAVKDGSRGLQSTDKYHEDYLSRSDRGTLPSDTLFTFQRQAYTRNNPPLFPPNAAAPAIAIDKNTIAHVPSAAASSCPFPSDESSE